MTRENERPYGEEDPIVSPQNLGVPGKYGQYVFAPGTINVGGSAIECFSTADDMCLLFAIGDTTLRELEEQEELVPYRVRRQRRYPAQRVRDYIELLEQRDHEHRLQKAKIKRSASNS
jgi:hypothetical protein